MSKEKMLKWLQEEVKKDESNLDKEKIDFINKIKKIDKNYIFQTKINKPNLWQRIKKVLMGI